MAFTGFPEEMLDFYEGLEIDNSRSYWQAHKSVYESAVRRPLEELAAALREEFGEPKLFRPYRDLRFSADQRPYQEHAALSAGGFYFSVSAAGSYTGGGYWHPAQDQLVRFRRAVDNSAGAQALHEMLEALRSNGVQLSGDDMLKSAPRGYRRDHPEIDLLRRKHLAVTQHRELGPWLHTEEALTFVRSSWRHMRSWNEWLARNVGPSTEPPPLPRGRRD